MGGINLNANRPQLNPAVGGMMNTGANPAGNPAAAPNGGISRGPQIPPAEVNRLRENYAATCRGNDNAIARGINAKKYSRAQQVGYVLKNIFLNVVTIGGYGIYQAVKYNESKDDGSQPVLNDRTGLVAEARKQHAEAISSFKFAHRTSINRFNQLCAKTVDDNGALLGRIKDGLVENEYCTRDRLDRIITDYRDTLVGYAQVAVLSKITDGVSDDEIVRRAFDQALRDIVNLGIGATEPEVVVPSDLQEMGSFMRFFSKFKNRLMCECADDPTEVNSNQKNETALRAVIDLVGRRCSCSSPVQREGVIERFFSGFEACNDYRGLRNRLISIETNLQAETAIRNELEQALEKAENLNKRELGELKRDVAMSGVPERLFDGDVANDVGNIGKLEDYEQPQMPSFRFRFELLKLKQEQPNMDNVERQKLALFRSLRLEVSSSTIDRLVSGADMPIVAGGKADVYRQFAAQAFELPEGVNLEDLTPAAFIAAYKEARQEFRGFDSALLCFMRELTEEQAQTLLARGVDIKEFLSPVISDPTGIEKLAGIYNNLGSALNGKTGGEIVEIVHGLVKLSNAQKDMLVKNAICAFPASFIKGEKQTEDIIRSISELKQEVHSAMAELDVEKFSTDDLRALCGDAFDAKKILARVKDNIKAAKEFAPKYENALKQFQDHARWVGVDPWTRTFGPESVNYLSADSLKSWQARMDGLEAKAKILDGLKAGHEAKDAQHDPIAMGVARFVLKLAPGDLAKDDEVSAMKDRLNTMLAGCGNILEAYRSGKSTDRVKATFDLLFNLNKTVFSALSAEENGRYVFFAKSPEVGADDIIENMPGVLNWILDESGVADELKRAFNDGTDLAWQITESEGYRKVHQLMSNLDDPNARLISDAQSLTRYYLEHSSEAVSGVSERPQELVGLSAKYGSPEEVERVRRFARTGELINVRNVHVLLGRVREGLPKEAGEKRAIVIARALMRLFAEIRFRQMAKGVKVDSFDELMGKFARKEMIAPCDFTLSEQQLEGLKKPLRDKFIQEFARCVEGKSNYNFSPETGVLSIAQREAWDGQMRINGKIAEEVDGVVMDGDRQVSEAALRNAGKGTSSTATKSGLAYHALMIRSFPGNNQLRSIVSCATSMTVGLPATLDGLFIGLDDDLAAAAKTGVGGHPNFQAQMGNFKNIKGLECLPADQSPVDKGLHDIRTDSDGRVRIESFRRVGTVLSGSFAKGLAFAREPDLDRKGLVYSAQTYRIVMTIDPQKKIEGIESCKDYPDIAIESIEALNTNEGWPDIQTAKDRFPG